MSPEPKESSLEETLSQVENGSTILIIQVPGNGEPRPTQTNLHICSCRLGELVGLTERGFIEKTSSKDHILFTRLENGSALLDRITREVLEECLGKTGAALLYECIP